MLQVSTDGCVDAQPRAPNDIPAILQAQGKLPTNGQQLPVGCKEQSAAVRCSTSHHSFSSTSGGLLAMAVCLHFTPDTAASLHFRPQRTLKLLWAADLVQKVPAGCIEDVDLIFKYLSGFKLCFLDAAEYVSCKHLPRCRTVRSWELPRRRVSGRTIGKMLWLLASARPAIASHICSLDLKNIIRPDSSVSQAA